MSGKRRLSEGKREEERAVNATETAIRNTIDAYL